MSLGDARHQKPGRSGRTVAGRGEAASEAVSDEATLARHAQTDCGVDDLIGQALTRATWRRRGTPRQGQQGKCRHRTYPREISERRGRYEDQPINQQPKAVMDAANSLPDSAALQGARRATGDTADSAATTKRPVADMEVVPRARRRHFTSADKRRILEAADRCTKPGEIGAPMRSEGVYSSSLSNWRRQREAAVLAALAPQKHGPKVCPNRGDALHSAGVTAAEPPTTL